MKKKIAYAFFTLTATGKDYLVKGNFGHDEERANEWAKKHKDERQILTHLHGGIDGIKYSNGLFVKKVEY